MAMPRLSKPLTAAGVAAATVAAGLVAATPTWARPQPRCTTSVPYVAGTEGYRAFRIPAIVATRSGALLAFAEGRLGGLGDAGNIDTVVRASTDGGCTWSALRVVHDHGADTAGNPAPVVTRGGRVVLLTTYNGGAATEAMILRGEVPAEQSRRVFTQFSDDDGATWSAPQEITANAKLANWRWYATGPGHAVRLDRGAHAGRLVVPANHSIAPPAGSTDNGSEAKYYGGHSLYSDDGGRTWHIGYVDDNPDNYVNVNETSATQLNDGRLYLNTREHNGTAPGNRADAYSADGGQSLLLPFRPQATIAGPVVQGSVLQPGGSDAPLLYAGPADPAARAALTIRTSRDQGATWQPKLALSGLPAAYSDLVQVDGSTIGVLYETGNFGANETIAYRRVALRDLW